MVHYEQPRIPAQQQEVPGVQSEMTPVPDCGETSYRGSGKLEGRAALITGADSGIGRAVAIAFAREGADVLISYLNEHGDAEDTARHVEEAGRRAVLVPGDLTDPAHCRAVVQRTVDEFGRLDVLVPNAAYQSLHDNIEDFTDEEFDHTFQLNVGHYFRLVKAALPHLKSGASIIATTSVNADSPGTPLALYSASKAAIANFSATLAQMLGPRGIRVNSVAPGAIWTPLIPATMPPDQVEDYGGQAPLGRTGQPAELAPLYVLLASDDGSYISGSMIPVTGGNPVL